jgi:hypothetical protein
LGLGGFLGIMYIHELPVHFGIIILIVIILLILLFGGFYVMITREELRERSWLNFLWILFLLFTFAIIGYRIYQLPAVATVDQLLPYTLAAWSAASLYALFSVFIWFTFDFFRKRQWLMFLFLIGSLLFLDLLWFFATPATTTAVSDGVMNWLAMPPIIVATGAVLAIIYLFLMDFIGTYQHNKTREGTIRLYNWIMWFSGLLVNISLILMALVFYLAPYMLVALGLAAIGLVILFINVIINIRALLQKK